MTQEELVEWLKEYRLNLMSLMGQDDYVTGKLDVIKDVLDKCNTKVTYNLKNPPLPPKDREISLGGAGRKKN